MYEKLLELNPEQIAIESNSEKFKGRSLVEIANENLIILAANDSSQGSLLGPFDIKEPVLNAPEMITLPIASEDDLPRSHDKTATYASTLYVGGKQGPIAPASGDSPSAIGLSAIGASAGAPDGDFGDGSSGGGGAGDGGSGDGGGDGDGHGGGHGGDK